MDALPNTPYRHIETHRIGGASAAIRAGTVRNTMDSYNVACIASGITCLLASLLVIRITRRRAGLAAA